MILYINSFMQKIIILIVFTLLLVPLSHSNEKPNKSDRLLTKGLQILNELDVECKKTGDKDVCKRYDTLYKSVHKKPYFNTSTLVKYLIIIFAIICLIYIIKKIIILRKK